MKRFALILIMLLLGTLLVTSCGSSGGKENEGSEGGNVGSEGGEEKPEGGNTGSEGGEEKPEGGNTGSEGEEEKPDDEQPTEPENELDALYAADAAVSISCYSSS